MIEHFSCVWAGLGDSQRAARLLGTADCQRERTGIPRGEQDQIHLDQFLGPARSTLSDEAWVGAYTEGRQLTMDEALAEGLSRLP